MNQKYIRTALSGLFTSAAVLCTSIASATEQKTLRSEFERVVGSVLGGELIVSCGQSNTFKINSRIIGKPRLYWQSGIEWQALEDASFKEAGVMFSGLGIEGGVPLEELEINTELPIFNFGPSHKKNTKKKYFIKSKSSGITPYEYTIDVVRSRLTLTNMLPITDYIRLDVEKYTKEQSSMDFSYAQTEEQKTEEMARKKDREDAIKTAIEKYDQDLEVVTPARKHRMSMHCHFEK